MSQQATLSEVQGPEEWTTSDGTKTFHMYTLIGEGLPGPVKVNRMPSSPVLAAGQSVWLEDLQPHPKFQGSFKAKVGKDPGSFGGQASFNGGGGQRGTDDATRASIERQSSLKAAVEYATGFSTPPGADEVVQVADKFYAWVSNA